LFFCKLFRLKVYDVCFFRFGNPAGYVVHETTDNFTQMGFVSMGPFFANTILCVLFCPAAFLPVWGAQGARPAGVLRLLAWDIDRDARIPLSNLWQSRRHAPNTEMRWQS
jgi:hypothetical protein